MKIPVCLGLEITKDCVRCLTYSEDGTLYTVFHMPSPTAEIDGRTCFDLSRLETLLDDFIDTSAEDYEVKSVELSDETETIVAVKDGRAASYPPLSSWEDLMKDNSEEADFYLPLSSYLAFRKTGVAAWTYAQAADSSLFDKENSCWKRDTGIKMDCAVLPESADCGVSGGIVFRVKGCK